MLTTDFRQTLDPELTRFVSCCIICKIWQTHTHTHTNWRGIWRVVEQVDHKGRNEMKNTRWSAWVCSRLVYCGSKTQNKLSIQNTTANPSLEDGPWWWRWCILWVRNSKSNISCNVLYVGCFSSLHVGQIHRCSDILLWRMISLRCKRSVVPVRMR